MPCRLMPKALEEGFGGELYIAHGHLCSWGFVSRNPSFRATDVNHAANSSVSYH